MKYLSLAASIHAHHGDARAARDDGAGRQAGRDPRGEMLVVKDEHDALFLWCTAIGAKGDTLRWAAFLAMWTRIGKDFAIDWIWWAATGESMRAVDHGGPVDAGTRRDARAFLRRSGLDMPEEPARG